MKKSLISLGMIACFLLQAEEAFVHPHQDISEYRMFGNTYKAVSSKALGAKEFEIWKSSLGVGSKTPRHVHETEEVFVLLKGKIKAIIGEKEVVCTAPTTLICPANIPHELINIGDEPSEQFAVIGIDSKICDVHDNEMKMPWR
jgi:quercetin dioxygenase-like cupin family protein